MEYKLTLEEAQRVVNYLAEFPYKEVADIIDHIKSQDKESKSK